MKGKGVSFLAVALLLIFALPGFAQTGVAGTIVRGSGFLAQWAEHADYDGRVGAA